MQSNVQPSPSPEQDHITIDFNETINSELVDQVQAMMDAMSPGTRSEKSPMVNLDTTRDAE